MPTKYPHTHTKNHSRNTRRPTPLTPIKNVSCSTSCWATDSHLFCRYIVCGWLILTQAEVTYTLFLNYYKCTLFCWQYSVVEESMGYLRHHLDSKQLFVWKHTSTTSSALIGGSGQHILWLYRVKQGAMKKNKDSSYRIVLGRSAYAAKCCSLVFCLRKSCVLFQI